MTLARGAEIRFTNMTLLASPSIRMPVRALFLALAVALIAAGPAAASGNDLQPVCAAGCVAAKPGTGALFLFSGHGWGHGIGMSQYGAWGYALHGYGYQQILSHYYPGTTLGSTTTTTVRVLLADRRKSLKLSSTAPFTVTDGNGVAHTLPAGSVSFGAALNIGAAGALPAPLTFTASSGAAMTLTRPYRGQIQVDVVNGRLRAIDLVGLEDYLYGVVHAEMPSAWSPPALQAQAVAARSYALATRKVAAPFDVYADTRSQVYLGISRETAATTAAVDATKGQVVMFAGKVASTFFFSSSGGETESISDGWGVAPVPYLVAVPDPYDVLSPYHNWGPVPISAHTFGQATPAADGSLLLPEAPAVTTDYRLATPAAAVGYVRVRVAPVVQLTGPTPGEVTGTVQPTLPGVPVEVDAQNADQTWTAVAT